MSTGPSDSHVTRVASLWRVPGFLAFGTYLVATGSVVLCVFYDASRATQSALGLDATVVWAYARNSLLIAFPAATACIVAAAYLAYRLRFLPARHTIFPVIALLTPFFSSPIGLYVGLKSLIGAGPLAFGIGLTFRYLPICVVVLLVTLYSLPIAITPAAKNLGVSELRLFRTVVAPVIGPNALLLLLLLLLLMPLDVIGSTVAGGGRRQTFGNLVFDYSHTRDAQATASLLTAVFLVGATAILILVITATARRADLAVQRSAGDLGVEQPLRTVYFNPVFLTYLCAYVVILITLFYQRPDVGSQYHELTDALGATMAIIAPITLMTGIVAMVIGCWLHLAGSNRAPVRAKLIVATLLIPALLPPVLAGRMAAVLQGFLGGAGGDAAIGLWYMYFFGPLPILVVLSHPLIFDRALPKVAINHRISGDDYVYEMVLPALSGAIAVGAILFAAVAISDAVIVRYIGGSTKTLGLVLANHQEGTLSTGDYVFLGGLGLSTLAAVLLAAAIMGLIQARRWLGHETTSVVRSPGGLRS